MAYFAKGSRLWTLRKTHPDRPSRETVASAIGVSTKTVYEWEKHHGGIKWPNAKAAAAYYGVEPESITTREDEEGDPDVALQVLDGARADQLDRIEEMLEETLERLKRISPPAEDEDDAGEGGQPSVPPDDPSLPPDSPDDVEPPSGEEDRRLTG